MIGHAHEPAPSGASFWPRVAPFGHPEEVEELRGPAAAEVPGVGAAESAQALRYGEGGGREQLRRVDGDGEPELLEPLRGTCIGSCRRAPS